VRTPALVVAGWGALNIVLVAVLAGFGEPAGVVAIYGSSAALAELAALVVWVRLRRRPVTRTWREAPNGDSAALFALGVLTACLGWLVAWPLALLALAPFWFALRREISLRRETAIRRDQS
jgi:hypothetical protein